ncbi:hypothetical protein EDEG_03415 [Edhazardia aedis USNM 41457]|uniref:Sphingolipid delta4-desaturase N-terminal domain-containing protein n=1 Tax=Edhazardia aedis (strain USNM 41457) TaxID=1003232 RepID=J9DLB4_EDHAE|nr:hypothetical protein EDEG_03415 [Edhazardia aedis USNM 41457]|eukprot:EJW02147.1 hypothetical protein EDEG_03415 [Edhazardia aedis USNM 41457]
MKSTEENDINEDIRAPYYKGFWKRSIPYQNEGFAYDLDFDEPHRKRRQAILKKYPQVTKLYGVSEYTWYIVLLVAFANLLGMYVSTLITSKYVFIFLCYFYGATLTALGGVLIHECGHHLVTKNKYGNIIMGYVSNSPIIFPIFSSFQKFHHFHHIHQGIEGKDPDLPLRIEYQLIKGSIPTKIIYIAVYPFLYIARSAFVKSKIWKTEIVNWIVHYTYLYVIYQILGIKPIFYCILSTYFGYSFHPAAAHLIQEHFTYVDGQETYSYYGPFNKLFMNIGYHNEHHDFPSVPWNKLPDIKKMAPEFYNCFHAQTSWFGVLFTFITKPTLGPQSRLARFDKTKNQ